VKGFWLLLSIAGCVAPHETYDVVVSAEFAPADRDAVLAGVSMWHSYIPELEQRAEVGACDGARICIHPGHDATDHRAGWTTLDLMNVTIDVEALADHGDGMRGVKQAAAHEVGHAMGLRHTAPGDLMAAMEPDQAWYVTENDRAQWWATR
jgi:hypothetical protein